MAPTLRCPAKKGAFSVGLNFVMGVDVSAFGFQKSVSMQLIPVPGPNGETCKRIGKPSGLSIYNLKSEMHEFMMLEPKIGGQSIPCIGPPKPPV